MTPHLENKLKAEIRKLVSNAKAILTNQIGFPLGVSKMHTLIVYINQIEPITNINFSVVNEYLSKIDGCPIGSERLQWEKEALKKQDKIIDEATYYYKDRIVDTCFHIINLLNN
ncbi:hypothetical protein [Segetibacter aerophilus]|uniref:DUF2489 domain-containing protein n=1 Tax=Segetibacter aerophilus TaxID=670293 RepID=A0A512BGM1_9BACT|nr:hypothetical protein [Segetibacter aerophilus]GEO11106.1 hypothetical protein SAE01_36020 [Segetibacter aerophilus]